ncbi:hypothetical protein KAW65_00375 [candidate division WOR-3 bacterium]|nr:hypothetical protein [candidate division WOR-3 bacterium]
MNWIDFVDGMKIALYECGQVALKLKGKVTTQRKKQDSQHQTSLELTDVDLLSQEIILLRAYSLVPSLEIYSEEIEECPKAVFSLFSKNKNRYVLIIDPLDGTKCYLAGGKAYAHMVGILDQETEKMECSLIYFPEKRELYSAVKGEGSWVQKCFYTKPEPIKPKNPPKTFGIVKRTKEKNCEIFQKHRFQLVKLNEENSSCASYQIQIAKGELGIVGMRHFHGHDTAIPGLIVQELGGAVVDAEGKSVKYDKTMARISLVISSLRKDYARILCKE